MHAYAHVMLTHECLTEWMYGNACVSCVVYVHMYCVYLHVCMNVRASAYVCCVCVFMYMYMYVCVFRYMVISISLCEWLFWACMLYTTVCIIMYIVIRACICACSYAWVWTYSITKIMLLSQMWIYTYTTMGCINSYVCVCSQHK